MVESQTIVWLVAIQHEVTTKSSRAIKILYKKIITKSRNKVRTNPAGSSNAPLNIRSYSFSQDRAKPTLERTKSSSKPCHSTRVFVETTGITSGLWRSSQRGTATKQRILNPTVSHFKVASRSLASLTRSPFGFRSFPSGSLRVRLWRFAPLCFHKPVMPVIQFHPSNLSCFIFSSPFG